MVYHWGWLPPLPVLETLCPLNFSTIFEFLKQFVWLKKDKLYVSKLPRAFVFWCAFDSAKFKLLIFFAWLIFFFFFSDFFVN